MDVVGLYISHDLGLLWYSYSRGSRRPQCCGYLSLILAVLCGSLQNISRRSTFDIQVIQNLAFCIFGRNLFRAVFSYVVTHINHKGTFRGLLC